MKKTDSTPLKQSLWQVPAIIVLAGLLAVGTNLLRKDGIAWVGDWSVQARFTDAAGDSLIISLELAELLFHQGGALFVDARPHAQYMEGHIQGALSLPWEDVDLSFGRIADRLEEDKTIIAYCDGESCDLSHEVALFLKQMRFDNVRVLVNGWTVWKQAGFPTAQESES